MSRLRASFAVAMATLLLVLGGCSVRARKAKLPPAAQTYRLPLYRPLTSRNPWIWGTFSSSYDFREWPVMMDTGAFHSALPHTFIDALGLKRRRGAEMLDARGRRKKVKGAIVPEVRFGDFEMRDVPFLDNVTMPLLGAEILSRRPWRIDRELGTVVFGAQPWAEDEVVGEASIHTALGTHYYSNVAIEGREVALTFDTGASVTTLREEDAVALGMQRQPLDQERKLTTSFGEVIVRDRYVAKQAHLGSMSFSDFDVLPLGQSRPRSSIEFVETKGLLGWGVLGRHAVWVDLGDRVQFKERASLVETAAARIRRWAWIPPCASVGCMTFEATRAEGERPDEFVVAVSRPFSRDFAALLACTTTDGQIIGERATTEVVVPARFAGKHTFQGKSGPEPSSDAMWASFAAACPKMVVLDINPVRYAFENRRPTPYLVYAPLTGAPPGIKSRNPER